MKRSSFLKALVVAVTAPSVLSKASMDKDVVAPVLRLVPTAEPNLFVDHLRFYIENGDKYNCGDLIVSDLGDKAMITALFNHGAIHPYTAIDARPIIMNTFRYKDINKFKIFKRIGHEKPIQKEKS
jgi:hypothetical protein